LSSDFTPASVKSIAIELLDWKESKTNPQIAAVSIAVNIAIPATTETASNKLPFPFCR
jgi:hypothetical protein